MATADNESSKNGLARDQHGRFAEGNGGGPGRPKGRPNKVTAALKDDILDAHRKRGGVKWLAELSDRDFVQLLGKIMPRQVAADVQVQASGLLSVDSSRLTEQELFAQACASRADDGDLTPPGEAQGDEEAGPHGE